MDGIMYLLRVGSAPGLRETVAARFAIGVPPEWVRLSTIAPLSNQGYREGTEGQLIQWDDFGVVVGVDNDSSIPRLFVPWQNIAYIGDGTSAYSEAEDLMAAAR